MSIASLAGGFPQRLSAADEGSRSTSVAPEQDRAAEYLFLMFLAVVLIEYGGLDNLFPFLKALRVSTLLAWSTSLLLLRKFGTRVFSDYRQSRLFTLLIVWTAVSVLWAVVRSHVPTTLRYMCDYLGLFVSSLYLIDRPRRMRWLSVVITATILIVVFRNLDNLNAGTRLVRFRAGYFMGDGNDLAWGFAMLLCAPIYLVLGRHPLVLKLFGMAGAVAAMGAIILTQSRGGSIALAGGLLYYWAFLAKRKALGAIAVVALAFGLAVFAPAGYFDRMNSIQEYEDDSSAQGRIRAWKAAAQMGLDYPLGVGAGNFSSAYGRFYRPDNLSGWAANRWISAHSVYFKVLGEYGYLGLLVLLIIIGSTLADNQRLARRIRSDPGKTEISDTWPACLNLGLVGYSLAAMFLGGITYPHLFIIAGLSLGARRAVEMDCLAPSVDTSSSPVVLRPRWQVPMTPAAPIAHQAASGRLYTAAWRGRRRG